MPGQEVLRGIVRPEWIDHNDHMNVAYYVLAFDEAVDRTWDRIGIAGEYVRDNQASTFAVDCHVTWQRELKLDDPYVITTQVLAYDSKRIYQFMRMFHADAGFVAATCEWLNLHVDLVRRRVVPWPAPVLASMARFTEAQPMSPPPDEICGRIHLGQALFSAGYPVDAPM